MAKTKAIRLSAEPEYTETSLDALRDVQLHDGHLLIVQRMFLYLDQCRKDLEQPADVERTANLRGQIFGIRRVLKIPDILKDEIAAGLEQEPPE